MILLGLVPECIEVGLARSPRVEAGLAGLAGLSLPGLMKLRAESAMKRSNKSVILVWMTGGPSHRAGHLECVAGCRRAAICRVGPDRADPAQIKRTRLGSYDRRASG